MQYTCTWDPEQYMRIINPHDDVLMGNAGSTADGAETALRLHVALYWLMATSCFFVLFVCECTIDL